TTEGIAFLFGAARSNAGGRSLFFFLERRTVLRMFTVAAIVFVASALRATHFLFLALGASSGGTSSRRGGGCGSNRSGSGRLDSRSGIDRGGLGSFLGTSFSFTTSGLFGALTGFFLGLQASG